MKRLVLPALIALAASGCMGSHAALVNPTEEASKCEMVQTLMREPAPQRYLAELAAGRDGSAQVLVFVRRPEEGSLERLFAGDEPRCGGDSYTVVQRSSTNALVLFLQPLGTGYTFDVQRATADELSLGGAPKGTLTRRDDGGWAASSL